MSFKGKIVFITGSSRGIGHAIGLRLAAEGATIIIAAKTVTDNPKLPGTIYTAAADMRQAGGQSLAIAVDIRFEEQVQAAVNETVEKFGGIDILINNASAINLSGSLDIDMKRYDLMSNINTRGTFLCARICLPYLLKAKNPHVLTLSPPLSMRAEWFGPHVAYTMSKYGMSMVTLGMAEEFKGKVAFNSIWPETTIATAVITNLLGGENIIRRSRKPEIVADAVFEILGRDARTCSGNFFIDSAVLNSIGVTDLEKYKVDPTIPDSDLQPDFYI